jgi:hypothetical protein
MPLTPEQAARLHELNEMRAITVYSLLADYPRPFVPEDDADRLAQDKALVELLYQHPAVRAIDAQIAALFPHLERG